MFFDDNKKSLAQQEAERKIEDFFEMADRNEVLPRQAQFVAQCLSIVTILATIWYLPMGMLWKFIGLTIGALLMVKWEQGKAQFLKDYHKGELLLHDKDIPQSILSRAEKLITAGRDAKKWLVVFVAGDLIVTIGCWMFTAYSEATAVKLAAVTAKGKVATQHLTAVSEAVKGGYGKSTMDAINGAAKGANAAISIDYFPIIITLVVAILVVVAVQGFTFLCAQWAQNSVYENQKKKFSTTQQRTNTPTQQQPTVQLPPIRRAG